MNRKKWMRSVYYLFRGLKARNGESYALAQCFRVAVTVLVHQLRRERL